MIKKKHFQGMEGERTGHVNMCAILCPSGWLKLTLGKDAQVLMGIWLNLLEARHDDGWVIKKFFPQRCAQQEDGQHVCTQECTLYPNHMALDKNALNGPQETRNTAWHSFVEEYYIAMKMCQYTKQWCLSTADLVTHFTWPSDRPSKARRTSALGEVGAVIWRDPGLPGSWSHN